MSSTAVEVGPASGPETSLIPESKQQEQSPRENPGHEEYQYLDLIRDILSEGEHRPDR